MDVVEALRTTDSPLLVTHRHADRDTIGSAIGLRELLGRGTICTPDGVARPAQSLLETFDTDPVTQPSAVTRDVVVVLDAPSTERIVPVDPVAPILIDHHEPEEDVDVAFSDVRPSMSSTSTILTKYVQEFDMKVSEAVATALLYGIRNETLDFKRDTTPADLTAAAYLHPFADHDTLEQVESPSMSPETLDVLAEAIQNREVQGSHLVSSAGYITDREALTQAAQHLLNLEGITTTAVFGIAEDTIYVAARSKDIRLDIRNVLQDAYSEIGDAAGHSTQASAAIPLGIFTGIEVTEDNRETLLELTEEAVKGKLFTAMGVESDGNGS